MLCGFQVYNCELEDVAQFHGLTDFCSTFHLKRGKTEDDEDDPSVVGEFKVKKPHFEEVSLSLSIPLSLNHFCCDIASFPSLCLPSGGSLLNFN